MVVPGPGRPEEGICLLNRHPFEKIPLGRIRRTLKKVFRLLGLWSKRRSEGAQTAAATFVFVSDQEIRRYNKRYLLHDRPTDVIAFPDRPGAPRSGFLGEIVVSLDTARRQAEEQGHPFLREVEVLTIHGPLHLIGYDDRNPRKRREMWRKTDDLLRRVSSP